mmetsp:Transcript_44000/g.58379  ORF Transcript_44000/g.58379 Transcript_44000/m.58379 type:complete len:119 (-) Transcript_44000:1596-1952(-)
MLRLENNLGVLKVDVVRVLTLAPLGVYTHIFRLLEEQMMTLIEFRRDVRVVLIGGLLQFLGASRAPVYSGLHIFQIYLLNGRAMSNLLCMLLLLLLLLESATLDQELEGLGLLLLYIL